MEYAMRKIPHWTESFTPGESIDILRDIALRHIERALSRESSLRSSLLDEEIAQPFGVNHIERKASSQRRSDVAKKFEHFIRKCDFLALAQYDLELNSPLWEDSIGTLKDLRQVVAFFSKLEELEVGIDKELEAFKTFKATEDLCRETNKIFKMVRRGEFSFSPRVSARIYEAQRKIARVLGPVPSWEALGYRFGKGATTLTKKRFASLTRKFADGVACSDEMLPAAQAVLGQLPALCTAWASAHVETSEESWWSVPVVLHDGILNFVNKDMAKHRATVTEPPLNGLAQMAVDDYLKPILRRRAGIDLTDQSRNQELARLGSRTGGIATLDLKSASDTIAIEAVAELLPLDWFSFLSLLRTGHVLYKGERIKLEKFSSMGNGFTFPLESLIFWALASACCEAGEIVSIYGDDIIIPSNRFDDVVELLNAVGFIPNTKKSFAKGPFRESCGVDCYLGIDVRPYFQKKWISGETLFTLHNFYVREGEKEMAEYVKTFIHPALHIYGPDGYGDGHLISECWEGRRSDRILKSGWAGFTFQTYKLRTRKDWEVYPNSAFVLPLYTVYRRGETPVIPKEVLSSSPIVERYDPERGWSEGNTEGPVRVKNAFWIKFLKRGIGQYHETLPLTTKKVEEAIIPGVDLPTVDAASPRDKAERPYKKVAIYIFEPG